MLQKKIDEKKKEIAHQLKKEKEIDAKLYMTTSEQILYDKQNRRKTSSVSRSRDPSPQKFEHQIYVK